MKSLKSKHIILLIVILVFIVFLCWTLYSTIRNPKERFTDVTESG